MFPLPLHLYLEAAAVLAFIICWPGLRHSPLKWFGIYLPFILTVELTGRYLRKILHQQNMWLYNFSIPIEYLFYAFIFWSHFKTGSFRSLAGWFMIIFPIIAIFNIVFVNGLHKFPSNPVTAGSFFMILFCLLYLYELYMHEEELNLWKEPMFYITTGVLLFNAGELTYNILSHYLINQGVDQAAKIFSKINNRLIWLLYSLLIIAFICKKAGTSRKV